MNYTSLNSIEKQSDDLANGLGNPQPLKPVLFIAYQFPPAGGPGVQRSVKFVNYLSQFNYRPIVLTIAEKNIMEVKQNLDQSLLRLLPKDTSIERVKFYQPIGIINFFNRIKLFRLLWFFLYPMFWEKSAFWPFQAYKSAKAIILKENIKIVYTTSGPFSSLILGFLLRKNLGVKWVADIRDPFTDGYQWSFPSKLHWHFMRRMERYIFTKCDHLIVNTDAVRTLYLKRGLIKETNISVITNGY